MCVEGSTILHVLCKNFKYSKTLVELVRLLIEKGLECKCEMCNMYSIIINYKLDVAVKQVEKKKTRVPESEFY